MKIKDLSAEVYCHQKDHKRQIDEIWTDKTRVILKNRVNKCRGGDKKKWI